MATAELSRPQIVEDIAAGEHLTAEDLLTPRIDTVLFAVTTNCNLRCTYCAVSLPIYEGEDFDLSNIEALASSFAAAHVRLVQISGHGETTLLPNWVELCEAFMRRDIAVCITSNFSNVFSDAEVDALARMVHITISIDTVDRQLLKDLRRKVDIRTILYNMQMVRMRAQKLGSLAKFNWQCTLSDAVVLGLVDWLEFGMLSGVSHFTLGNLIEHVDLPNGPMHPGKLKPPQLTAACEKLSALIKRAREAGVTLVLQPGIVQSMNARCREFGINSQLLDETP
jgi:pyruvate-formate lyase-activating enzyme